MVLMVDAAPTCQKIHLAHDKSTASRDIAILMSSDDPTIGDLDEITLILGGSHNRFRFSMIPKDPHHIYRSSQNPSHQFSAVFIFICFPKELWD